MTPAAKPPWWDDATAFLCAADPVLARLVVAYPGIHLARRSDPFTALSRAIVGQQISVKAAQAIWDRLVSATAPASSALGGTAGAMMPRDPAPGELPRLDPARLAATPMAALMKVGLSTRKAEYLRDLAGHFLSGALVPSAWPALGDEALIDALVDVKGIGRWTAEMFLIFHELRADVLPLDDIGLQKAIALHYHGGKRRARSTLERLARRWRPYRSAATWYLWRSLDPIPVEY